MRGAKNASMKSIKSMSLLLAVAAALAALTSACSTSGSDRYEYSSKEGARYNEKKVRFKGTVVYSREYGYYINSDSGEQYKPIHLERPYRRNGLRVQVYGKTQGYAMGGNAWKLEIYDIATR
jgi:hypothetical protein